MRHFRMYLNLKKNKKIAFKTPMKVLAFKFKKLWKLNRLNLIGMIFEMLYISNIEFLNQKVPIVNKNYRIL